MTPGVHSGWRPPELVVSVDWRRAQAGEIPWPDGALIAHARRGRFDVYLAAVPLPTRSTLHLGVWVEWLRAGIARQHCRLVRPCGRVTRRKRVPACRSGRCVRDHPSAVLAAV